MNRGVASGVLVMKRARPLGFLLERWVCVTPWGFATKEGVALEFLIMEKLRLMFVSVQLMKAVCSSHITI